MKSRSTNVIGVQPITASMLTQHAAAVARYV